MIALVALLLLLAAPAFAQERACPDERDQLRVLTRHLSESRLNAEAALADAQLREQKLLRQIEELKAKVEAPKK